jgi:hypothetical protein
MRMGLVLRVALLVACALTVIGAGTASAAIFWVNTDNNSIGVAGLGSKHATKVNQQLVRGLGLAEGVATGPNDDIYWSDSSNNRISRAHLYYDKRRRLHVRVTRNFITGADNPQGVAVYGGYIYWVNNDYAGSIGRALLNGTDVNQNFVANESASGGNDINYATGIAVTPQYIYWADSNQNSIARASTATGDDVQQFITDLTLGGMSSDPRGVAVSGPYIYWANDLDNGSIGRANLDGSDVNDDFIAGALGPCMVAVGGGYIYWTNNGYGKTASTVGRAKLDGSGATERYVTGASSPCGVAVNGFTLKSPRRHHHRR